MVAIMGIFVAIFSLVNLDLSWVSSQMPVSTLVVLDLSIVGGMAALVGLISALIGKSQKSTRCLPWIVAVVSFTVAIVLLCLL